MPFNISEKCIDNKISEKEFKSIMESLNHIFIFFMEIPNGIDIMWDYANFYYYLRHIGITHYVPNTFTKILATKSHTARDIKLHGHPRTDATLFNLPQAYYELKNYLEVNKYYFVTIENYEESNNG